MGWIRVQNLGKAYKHYPTRTSRLREWMFPFLGPQHQLTWVLRDVNFEVAPGDAVGIIGINGAGKSTLLKLIVGTTQATTGTCAITGRVAALLELGLGFHAEFTGRQNVLMAGQLMGLSEPEIIDLMPSIEAFAEIGEYIDQPVRVYSSGMQMRLAFSVATARRPDVLIVDEALSVGDAYFQHKSFERIREFRKQGTTLLIVSHDKSAIQALCDRAILLNDGALAMEGSPDSVMDYYNAMLAKREHQKVRLQTLEGGRTQTISGSGNASVLAIALLNDDNQPVEHIEVGNPATLQIKVAIHEAIPCLVLGYLIKDRLGQPIFGTNTHIKGLPLANMLPDEEVTYHFSFPMNLGPGSYSISTALVNSDTHLDENYEWKDLALVFSVTNLRHDYFEGCAWLDPSIAIERA